MATPMDQAVRLRELGQTGIMISPIGLGCWQFAGKLGGTATWNTVTDSEANAIVQAALDGGINWFDTAELYGFGHSERVLARALKLAGQQDGDVVIATKWSPLLRTANAIRRTISRRQQCLEGYSIDLYQIHFPRSLATREAEMRAMADLVDAGKIRSIGVSNFSADEMRRCQATLAARGMQLASNQVRYSLLDRRIESNGVLDTAKELGMTIIAYSPLQMGLLTGKFHQNPELINSRPMIRRAMLRNQLESSRALINVLDEIARNHGVTISQVVLNWIINFHGDTVVAIPGASKVHHAEQNTVAMTFALTPDEMAQIDELSKQYKAL